jgi:hypothetical protein
MKKGQSTIIGFILVTAIAIIIVSLTLFWAAPLLEKSRNQVEVQRLEQKFIELHETIVKVAAEQGELSFPFTINKGTINLDPENNEIVYKSQIELNAPIPCRIIFGGASCIGIPEVGQIGTNESAYLKEQASVDFILHYRTLNQSDGSCYRIKLRPGDQTTAGVGRHTIFLTWLQENQTNITLVGLNGSCDAGILLREQLVEFNIA